MFYKIRLYLFCENSNYGCQSVIKLDSLDSHLSECEYNPKRPFPCEQGCGLIIPKDEHKVCIEVFIFYLFGFYKIFYNIFKDHNCVKELRELVHKQQQKINEMQQDMATYRYEITGIKDEMRVLKVKSLFLLLTLNV